MMKWRDRRQPHAPVGEQPRQLDATLTLIAVHTAVRVARMFIATTLRAWGLTWLIDTAELLTSEMVTNAVKATGIIAPHVKPHELTGLKRLHLRATIYQNSLFISVWDSDPRPPVLLEADDLEAEGGRGLLLVSSLARRWSYYATRGGGKVVWCELELAPVTQAGLPLKQRPSHPLHPIEAIRDRVTLLRVRDALLAL